jgi:hypothetical protein
VTRKSFSSLRNIFGGLLPRGIVTASHSTFLNYVFRLANLYEYTVARAPLSLEYLCTNMTFVPR